MPFTDVGFFVKRRGLGAAGGVTPTPGRDLVITPTITSNGERVVWTITSNMAANVVLNYEIIGANVETFYEGALTGNITLNNNGDTTLERNLDPFYEYASTTDKPVQLKVFSPSNVLLATSTSNVIVGAANAFAANGGNTFTFTGGVDNLKGEYTVHKFDTVGSANITVTNLGAYPSNINIDVVVIGGGGAGGEAAWNNSVENLTPEEIADDFMGSYKGYAGSGGAGGNVNITALNASGFNTQTYPLYVGNGAASASTTEGQTSWFSASANIVALGGKSGQPNINAALTDPANVIATGGNSTVFTGGAGATRTYFVPMSAFDPTPKYTWIERTGGGGAGATQNGSNATISTGSFGPTATDGFGGAGGNGRAFTITGNVIVAGGGGGGGAINQVDSGASGGSGGGGTGARGAWQSNPGGLATAGTATLGGGGGGGGGGVYSRTFALRNKKALNYTTSNNVYTVNFSSANGGAGGTGAVYVRYLSKYRQLSIE
jgi:hypothetical protein